MKRFFIITLFLLSWGTLAFSQDVTDVINMGDSLFKKGDYKNAALAYEEGVAVIEAKAPDEYIPIAVIRMQLGNCYLMMNNNNYALLNYHEALKDAKRGIVVDRERAVQIMFSAYGAILDIYDSQGMTGPMLDITDDFIAFIGEYKKAPLSTDIIPQSEVDNFLAYCLAQKGERLDEALGLIDKALKTEPESAAFIDTRGWILLKMGRVTEARDELKKALGICKKADDNCTVIEKHLKKALGETR
jgi:tetratricopeptide (TPR) repeat protein